MFFSLGLGFSFELLRVFGVFTVIQGFGGYIASMAAQVSELRWPEPKGFKLSKAPRRLPALVAPHSESGASKVHGYFYV